MNGTRIHLDLIEVPNPCPVPWAGMAGDDRVRHCGQCQKNVFNLSEMSRAEAEELVRRHDGELCAQFYRRADGTVVTRSCAPVRLWRGLTTTTGVVVAWLLAVTWLSRIMSAAPANSTFSFVGGSIRVPSAAGSSAWGCPPASQEAPSPRPADSGK